MCQKAKGTISVDAGDHCKQKEQHELYYSGSSCVKR